MPSVCQHKTRQPFRSKLFLFLVYLRNVKPDIMTIRTFFLVLALCSGYVFQLQGQVIINELRLDLGYVELYNTADTAVDVSTWELCNRPSYATINSLTIISGATNMPAKSYLVLEWAQISSGANELGLYKQAPFGSVANIRDYVMYGGIPASSRASVAVSAGVWSNVNDFVPLPPLDRHVLECINFQASDGTDTDLDDWAAGFRSIGESNHDNVIINELNLDGQWVELKNTGNAPIDVSNWELCDRPSYAKISNLTILSGVNPIPADSYLVIQWNPISDAVGELALYIARPFGTTGNIRDYTVYGGLPGSSRIGVAVNAGVWDSTTQFIPFPVVDTNSLQNNDFDAVSGIQTNVDDWTEDIPTQGQMNNETECPPSYSSANGNALTGTESGMVTYQTDGIIESDQLIQSTAMVIYDSGTSIDLLSEFEVELGGEFTAEIGGCD